MGCGGSKCDPKADILPAKIRPLLLRRLDEMRRRSRNIVSSTSLAADLSKKELLKDGIISDDDNSAPHNHFPLTKITTSNQLLQNKPANDVVFDDADDVVAKEAQPPSSPLPLRSPRVAPEPEPEPEKLLKQRSKKPEQDMMPIKTIDTSAVGDKFRDDSLYPGSPSFRFYFIESLTDHKDEDHDHSDKEDEDSDKKSQTDQSSSVEVDSINSDPATKTKMKTRRAHRFRKVIPKARSGAVKNLLNVRSCYNPSCGGHQDNASLLRQKTPHSI